MKAAACFSTVLLLFFAGCSSTPTPAAPEPETAGELALASASTPYGNKVIHLNVPDRLSDLQMRQAILNAGYENGWQVVGNGMVGEEGMVAIRKKSLFAETTFTFLFGPTAINGYTDSYTLDVTGKRTRRYTPPLRIDTIRDSIKKNLTALMAGY